LITLEYFSFPSPPSTCYQTIRSVLKYRVFFSNLKIKNITAGCEYKHQMYKIYYYYKRRTIYISYDINISTHNMCFRSKTIIIPVCIIRIWLREYGKFDLLKPRMCNDVNIIVGKRVIYYFDGTF